MNNIMLCMLLLFSFNSMAAFEQVWIAYKKSTAKEIRDINSKSIDEKFNFDKEFTTWSFELTAAQNSDSLKSLNSLTPAETITNTYSAKLTKPTLKYGSFSLEHKQIHYDISKWGAAFKTGLDGDKQYDIRTILGYSYDFLNDELSLQNDIIKSDYEEKATAAKLNQENESLSVFTRFIQAKLNLYQIRLSRENAKRAKKRMSIIKKRVRSGSSRKVDLHLANSSYLTQRENIETAKKNLEENLALLEFILGRRVDKKLLKFVTWNKVPKKSQRAPKKNLDLLLLEKRLQLSHASLLKNKNDSNSSLTLKLQYETNGVRNQRSDAFSDNFDDNDNKTAAIVWSMPLGLDRNSALKRRLALEKKLRQKQVDNKKSEIKIQTQALTKQIYYTKNAFKDAKNRSLSLRQAMKETNKLYSRGQSNFDEVIRREENYISAKLSEKSTLASLELLIANLAFLEGNIESYLDSYRD